MNMLRIAAALTWIYAACFGVPAIPVAIYLNRRGTLPTVGDLFAMYGGPWSARLAHSTFIVLLIAFLVTTLVAAWAAWLAWNGSKTGALLTFVLLPIEAVFWIGFALPIPWLFGAARAILLVLGWRSLH